MKLLLLRKFHAEGILPNFERLLKRGSANRLLCAIPAWTPTNWASVVTGTTAGTHGLGGWSVRKLSDPTTIPDIRAEDSRAMGAETIWEVAERAGLKTMITFYPASWPPRIRDGYVIAPGFRNPPFALMPPQTYRIEIGSGRLSNDSTLGAVRIGTDVAETGEERLTSSIVARQISDKRFEAAITADGVSDGPAILTISIALKAKGVAVTARGDKASGAHVPIEGGTWSEWLFAHVLDGDGESRRVSFRLRLLAQDDKSLTIVRSEAHRTDGFSSPASLAAELVEQVGPFIGMFSTKPGPTDTELDACLDEYLYSGLWQARAARYVLENYDWDIHFCHWHLFDTINHSHVNPADTGHPQYDPKRGEWHLNAHRRAFLVADEVLGEFLELVDDDMFIVVNSDHAMAVSHRWGSVPRLLQEHGLLAYQDDGVTVDAARSQAYVIPDRGSEIFVNVRGREPQGIVPQQDYESVQEAIIDALHNWRDPESGKRAVAIALKIQDAQVIGFWGTNNGDVIFTLNRGFGWGDPLGPGSIGPGRGALHGSQIPTSEGSIFTNMGCFLIAGPGIKMGYEREWTKQGLMRMVDLAPTMAHLMGLKSPAHNQGAVLLDLLIDP